MCPDRIDKQDYFKIKEQLTESECELLDSWYKQAEPIVNTCCSGVESCYYELKYFNNLTEHSNTTRAEGIKQLNKLLEIFEKTLKNNLNDLKQKYLKSIQETEVELAIQYLNSYSIIWFEHTKQTDVTVCTEENYIFKELQSRVYTRNYKNYKVEVTSSKDGANELVNDTAYLESLSQFVDEACKKAIDYHTEEFKPYKTFLSECLVTILFF